ncbi:GNAT family N-acetyltransferase [Bacillus sp. FJAT-52991]|uniref:GNAT family N-acetyltransferase n=1 Tax=Bacillus kandeliae TaxID=3129297 RepID=A0ABZ2N8M3_9BACI
MNNYVIRPFQDQTDFEQMQVLEQKVWGIEPTPIPQTLTVHQHGGLLIGAFAEETLIGFSYGFTGFSNGHTYLCSHMLAIDPEYQKTGIGKALKDAQKQEAIKLGYDLLTWTFDPLESVNAYLNLTKLKAICDTYKVNCYGEMKDGLNKGLPTDRLKVDWWIQSSYVNGDQTFTDEQAIIFADYEITPAGFPKISLIHSEYASNKNSVLVPVTKNFQEIKTKDRDLAMDWRMKMREIFTQLFAEGYAVVKLLPRPDKPVHYYLFVQKNLINLEREG